MIPLTIHIGMNKTGTTALQRTIFHNRAALLRAGLLYPKVGMGSRSAGAGLHFKLSAAFRKGGMGGEALVQDLLHEIDGSKASAALVSSEFFVEVRDVAALAKTLAGRPVRILVYLRRHDHWVNSLFSQAIKSQAGPPWAPNVEAFIDHIQKNLAHYFTYSRLLDRWADAFGQDALEVRLYDGAGAQDIVADVLGDFGLVPGEIAGFKPRTERLNVSPSRRQLAAIDHVQRAPYPESVRRSLINRILAKADAGATCQLMTATTARDLLTAQAEDYADIARRYFGRPGGPLFDEAPPAPEGPKRIALWPGEGIGVLSQLLAETL
ncbi:MAG: hypothetical protein AAF689_11790 [Pseudomonadota bacterium]